MLVNRAEPLYRQIALHFEKEIFEGRLKAGDKLPSTRELVSIFGVNHESIQSGLALLAERGLIERRRKCGTFVKASAPARSIALVFERSLRSRPDMAFFNVLLESVSDLAEAKGWGVKLYPTRQGEAFNQGVFELERDISSGAVSAVLNISAGDETGALLKKHCLVPYFVLPIELDLADFIAQGISHLAACGRRRPALLFDERHLPREAAEAALAVQAAKFGFERVPAFHATPSQLGGYEAAKRILDAGERIDALLVLFDSSFRGVLYHLLERGVRIPEEMALISHSNKGIEIMCHMPLTRLEFDPDAFAKQAFGKVAAVLEGKPFKTEPVKARLLKGRTCGEAGT